MWGESWEMQLGYALGLGKAVQGSFVLGHSLDSGDPPSLQSPLHDEDNNQQDKHSRIFSASNEATF